MTLIYRRRSSGYDRTSRYHKSRYDIFARLNYKNILDLNTTEQDTLSLSPEIDVHVDISYDNREQILLTDSEKQRTPDLL